MQRRIDEKDKAGRESDLAKAGHCGSICANAGKSSSVERDQPPSAPRSGDRAGRAHHEIKHRGLEM
jgi:hypothetical protein